MTNTELQDFFNLKTTAITAVTTTSTDAEITTYVNAIFQAVLGRDPAATGLANISAAIKAGTFSETEFANVALTANVNDVKFDYLTADEKTAAATSQTTAKSAFATDFTAKAVSLTTGVDALTGSLTGDTFNASLLSLTATDSIVDASTTDNDTLDAEINSNVAQTVVLTNVENLNFTSYGTTTIDMTYMTGVNTVTSKSSTGVINLDDVTTATMGVGFNAGSTNSIDVDYAAGVLSGAADVLNVNLNASTATALDVNSGFESMVINVDSNSDIDTLTTPGVTSVSITGTGNVDFAAATLDATATITATSYTGAMTTGAVSPITGYAASAITGATTGTSILLGSGNDAIGFTSATSASTYSNTVKLGAGDDTVTINAAGNATSGTFVFGEAGDDKVQANTTALTAYDLIDGGAGTDTLDLNVAASTLLLRGVENLNLTATATSATVSSSDTALTVTQSVTGGSAVDLNDLTAGSTVSVVSTTGTTGQAGAVAVEFLTTEAASTINVTAGMTGILETEKITDVTVNLGVASDIAGHYSFINATDLTINATGDLSASTGKNIVDATATNVLTNVTVAGTEIVKLGTVTSTVMDVVTVTAAEALTVDTIGSDSTKTSTVTLTSTTSTLSVGHIGKSDNTDAISVDLNAAAAISGTNSIISTKIANVTMDSTAGAVTMGAIGANATEIGDITTNAKGDITQALIGKAAAIATSMGTISMTSTSGKIELDATNSIGATDVNGITVNLTAATTIGNTGVTNAAVVENAEGSITASLAGTAEAKINYTVSGTSNNDVVNLSATNTGGLTTVITNDGTAASGETSTITLGDALITKTNAVTVAGTVDTLVVTGGTGLDEVTIGIADLKTLTIDLGASTGTTLDKVDFTAYTANTTLTNAATHTGLVINLGVSATVDGDTVSLGSVIQYNDDGAADAKLDTAGPSMSLTGVESVVGTAFADYIIANSTGSTIQGGDELDDIYLAAGVDHLVYGAASTDAAPDGTITLAAGAVTLTAATNWTVAAADSFVGLEVVNGLSTADASGETITLGNADITAIVAGTVGTIIDDTACIVQGVYTASTDTFVVGTGLNTGADSILIWDTDDSATISYNAIVLVGVDSTVEGYLTASAGVLTM